MTPGDLERARWCLANAVVAAGLSCEILRRGLAQAKARAPRGSCPQALETVGQAHELLLDVAEVIETLVTPPAWRGMRCQTCSWRLEIGEGGPDAAALAAELSRHLAGHLVPKADPLPALDAGTAAGG